MSQVKTFFVIGLDVLDESSNIGYIEATNPQAEAAGSRLTIKPDATTSNGRRKSETQHRH